MEKTSGRIFSLVRKWCLLGCRSSYHPSYILDGQNTSLPQSKGTFHNCHKHSETIGSETLPCWLVLSAHLQAPYPVPDLHVSRLLKESLICFSITIRSSPLPQTADLVTKDWIKEAAEYLSFFHTFQNKVFSLITQPRITFYSVFLLLQMYL